MQNLILPQIETYWYLATPYSRYPSGIHMAWVDACRAMAELVAAGVPVYSPIAETHPIATFGNLDPLDHRIWLPADRPKMDAAGGLLVLLMPSWESSYGIKAELEVFRQARKPIVYLSWPEMEAVTPEVAC